LDSVGKLDAFTVDQIQQACLERTEKFAEADYLKSDTDEDQNPNLPAARSL